jgi:hypothetical protein
VDRLSWIEIGFDGTDFVRNSGATIEDIVVPVFRVVPVHVRRLEKNGS